VNILLDNPMTHSPFPWILSLNWLCQKWGQLHIGVDLPVNIRFGMVDNLMLVFIAQAIVGA
jgi:hypothetical protein